MSQWWVNRSSIAVVVFWRRPENLRPIGEGQIRGDQQGRVFVEFANQVEQQLAARLAERQVAQLIDDDEIVTQQLLGQAATATGRLLLLELVDQINEIEEASARTGADDRARRARIRRWVLPVPVPPMKIALRLASRSVPVDKFGHLAFVDRRVGKDLFAGVA